MFGSDKVLERVVETNISALEEFSSNAKHAEKINILEQVSPDTPSLLATITSTLQELLSDVYTTYNCLKTVENSLRPYSR